MVQQTNLINTIRLRVTKQFESTIDIVEATLDHAYETALTARRIGTGSDDYGD